MSKPMICTNCFRMTTDTEANDRKYNTSKCNHCGGELKPHKHDDEEQPDLAPAHPPTGLREPTDEERKQYSYLVETNIDVKRTDGAHLTAGERKMVDAALVAAEAAIAQVMAAHGQPNEKKLGNTRKHY